MAKDDDTVDAVATEETHALSEAVDGLEVKTDKASDVHQALMEDMRGLRHLYANVHLSDVLFVFPNENAKAAVDDGEERDAPSSSSPEQHLLPAHRIVLALRSGAFHTAFLRSKSSQVPAQVRFPIKIIIEDTSFLVFSTLIKFLYTNEIALEPVDRASRVKTDEREQFWKELLRAAYVYLVPSLVEICVQQLMQVVNAKAKEQDAITTADGEAVDMRYLRRVLDILVFTDGILATKSNDAHRRTSVQASETNGAASPRRNGSHAADFGAPRSNRDSTSSCDIDRCSQRVQQLQSLCLSKLERTTDAQFEPLIRSEAGKQCSTERLCSILKHRSRVPLVVAVRYQLARAVNELLRMCEPLDKTDDVEKDLPLVAALKTGNDSIIRRLLVDADAPFFLLTDKIPIFFLACASGNLLHCQILVDHKPENVNLISPLEDGDKEILHEYGRRQTPLHVASSKGHFKIVELLLNNQAASNLQDEEGNTALHLAANIETAEVLLRNSHRTNPNIPNRRGQTPFHVAAANGNVGVVDLLIRNGADQDIVDDQGQNAFHLAAANGHTAVALVLLHSNDEPQQSLALTKKPSSEQDGEDSRVEDGVNGVDIQESRPLFNINQEDMKGNTALHHAAMSPSERCQKMLQLLLENGADPNRSNWFGYTPLHLFCSHQNGPASVVDVFIEHNVNIRLQSLDGSTPLHLAVGRASKDVAVSLVIAGAHVHLQDAAGRSVVDLAESTNQGVMLVPVLRNLSVPPEWVPDDQVAECSSCHAVFRMAMRKHHCRHCGRIICYNCSSNKIAIPKFQLVKPARVCDTCHDVLSFRRLL
ncbi:hypothetical protein Poli38472_013856 [Pythium oligandrum]|uniref:Ankyrin repeat and FYVE domain-containing protein 1 n=1 Tax=Pythium oligandrum TaxID=41045 RepID=A0A8K1FBR3_PYTOL|nr:hypothetical protein Poli38472_013856 [Pythium oligandrum]|eukprot:TMW55094.1 hypothetical protein Poli38472_013856 [Pythium oligandrum]